jgi:hypothetical protein
MARKGSPRSVRRRYSYRLLALVIAVPGGMVFNVLIKYMFTDPARSSTIPSSPIDIVTEAQAPVLIGEPSSTT